MTLLNRLFCLIAELRDRMRYANEPVVEARRRVFRKYAKAVVVADSKKAEGE